MYLYTCTCIHVPVYMYLYITCTCIQVLYTVYLYGTCADNYFLLLLLILLLLLLADRAGSDSILSQACRAGSALQNAKITPVNSCHQFCMPVMWPVIYTIRYACHGTNAVCLSCDQLYIQYACHVTSYIYSMHVMWSILVHKLQLRVRNYCRYVCTIIECSYAVKNSGLFWPSAYNIHIPITRSPWFPDDRPLSWLPGF